MKKTLMMTSAALLVFGLAGCASDYVISTKDGNMILTDGKPKLDKSTGLLSYTDEQGNERQINNDNVSQVMER
ncbi:YgdI/YgdR family lipoprotein [Rahnella inusitata]|uniref:YgdI/YgdR family lipoprotein n=1 Tax=Rahnella inusitata TaxID=58169 RepID=UPI0015DC2F64|nr:YgdI/YgdR family lipoprotein [Enterobacteriaceae bacterium Kacie_13]